MPSWGYWTLIGSVAAALIIMLVAFFVTRMKINRVRDQFLTDEANGVAPSKAPELRGEKAGQMLWDLKEKTKDPLDDIVMEYSINTMLRNSYVRAAVIGGSKYEEESLKELAGAKIVDVDLDYVLIMDNKNINEDFDAAYPSVRMGGMISIVGMKKKHPDVKKLFGYLKSTGIRYDYLKVSKGIILVVK